MWGFIGFLAGLLLVVYLPLWLLDRRHEKKVDREIREKEVREAHALPGLLEPLPQERNIRCATAVGVDTVHG